ncbi:MAG: efflux RND transporter periplasmic adaptor subunit [Bacteroidales bacterium]
MDKKSIKTGFILLLCCLASSCKQAPTGMSNSEYQLLTVQPSDRTISSTYSATIRGRQDIAIYPQVSGTLTKVCVTEGERIKHGQTLFIIDQVPYQAALQTAEANVEAAEAALSSAKLTYESRQELYKENVVSEFDLNISKNAMLAAKAQLSQTKAQKLTASNNFSYTIVKSPSDGVVGTLPYRVGALVGANLPQPLTTVSDNSDMYVYFSMTENQLLGLIRQYGSKDKALKQMPAINLQLNDKSIYPQKGEIESISGVIDPNTGSVSLRAIFPNKENLLHSGGAGNVIIPIQKNGCIVIPQSATFNLQDKTYIYKVIDGKAQSYQIQVTRVNGGKEFIVDNGLVTGDIIVAEGVGLLREGSPVQPKKAAAKTPAHSKSK